MALIMKIVLIILNHDLYVADHKISADIIIVLWCAFLLIVNILINALITRLTTVQIINYILLE